MKFYCEFKLKNSDTTMIKRRRQQQMMAFKIMSKIALIVKYAQFIFPWGRHKRRNHRTKICQEPNLPQCWNTNCEQINVYVCFCVRALDWIQVSSAGTKFMHYIFLLDFGKVFFSWVNCERACAGKRERENVKF